MLQGSKLLENVNYILVLLIGLLFAVAAVAGLARTTHFAANGSACGV